MEQLSFDDLEVWKPVPGLEDRYEVSNLGPVRSLYRGSMLILSPSYSNSGGYPLYILMRNGVRYPRYGHRLVMEAFVGPLPDGLETRHLDDDPRNNALSNLIYGTSGENKADMLQNGGHFQASQTHCANGHKYTEENTHVQFRPDGSFKQRTCRACQNERVREWRKNNAANMPPCTKDDCEGPQLAKGLCSKHYHQQRRETKRKAA